MACHYRAGSSVKLLCAVSFCDSNPGQEEVAPALGCRRTEGRSTARVHSALQRGPLQTPSGGLDPYLQVPCPLLHEKGVAGGSEVQAARTARAPRAHPAQAAAHRLQASPGAARRAFQKPRNTFPSRLCFPPSLPSATLSLSKTPWREHVKANGIPWLQQPRTLYLFSLVKAGNSPFDFQRPQRVCAVPEEEA